MAEPRGHERLPRPRPADLAVLILSLALYGLLRGQILHADIDAVAVPEYEHTTTGNLAKAIAEGNGGPPLAQYYDQCGGRLVVGLLAAPLFAAGWDSLLALKLVPCLLGAVALVLVWWLLLRHFDALAAALAALSFALACPLLTKFSMIAMGSHFESLPFTWAFLAAFFAVHTGAHRRAWLLVAGLAAGFLLFFYLGSPLVLAPCVLVHLLVRGLRPSLRDLAWAGPGFAVGALPLAWIELSSAGRSSSIAGDWVGHGSLSPSALFARANALLAELPRSAGFDAQGGLAGRIAGPALVACFALAWIVLAADLVVRLRRGARAGSARSRFAELAVLPLLLYPPLVVLTVAVLRVRFVPFGPPVEVGQYRYLVPFHVVALALAALGAARLLRSSAWPARALGAGLALVPLATGSLSISLVRAGSPLRGHAAAYDGFSFASYYNTLLRDAAQASDWNAAQVARDVAEFRPPYRSQSYQSVGYAIGLKGLHARAGPLEPIDLAAIRVFPAEHAFDLALGAGSALRQLGSRVRGPEGLAATLDALEAEDPALAEAVAVGLGLDPRYPLVWRLPLIARQVAVVRGMAPPRFQGAIERGLGMGCARILERGLAPDREFVRAMHDSSPEASRGELCFGVGWGLAATDSPSLAAAAGFPLDHPRDVERGFEAGLTHLYGRERAAEMLAHAADRAAGSE